MARFMAKVLLLLCTLLLGMLLGIQQAEHGIFSLVGVISPDGKSVEGERAKEKVAESEQPIFIKRIDGEKVEVGYVGEPFSLQQLEEKEKEWKETHTPNRYSQIARTIGDAVYSLSQKGARWFTDQLAKVL